MADEALASGDPTRQVKTPTWLGVLCKIFAAFGGISLLGIMLVTVISVVKRSVLGSPVPGDFELVELGCALAIFCFLPVCQLSGGNVLVDFFTQKASSRTKHWLGALGDFIYLVIAALLAWRLTLGGMEMHEYDEQTMVLRLPVGMTFLVIIPAMVLLAVTCAATMMGHVRAARQSDHEGAV